MYFNIITDNKKEMYICTLHVGKSTACALQMAMKVSYIELSMQEYPISSYDTFEIICHQTRLSIQNIE